MKKPKSNQKRRITKAKLKHYSALAASVIAIDGSAQVVYTNINNLTLVNNGDYFDIDLNNDGIREGRIEFIDTNYSSTSYSLNIKAAEVDSLFNASVNFVSSIFSTTTGTSTSTSTTYVAAAINLNTPINNNLNSWTANTGTSTGTSSSALNGILIGGKAIGSVSSSPVSTNVGQFPGAGDKFLGVKFTIGTSTHYGWIRLDMTANSSSITIKDYAFETTPNRQILAGDMVGSVGLTEQNKNKFDYFSANGKINIKSELTENSILSIYDLSGKLIQSEAIGLNKEVSIQKNLEGIYIVEIRNSTGVTRKKLWLESN